jgi:hypothetical protein
MLAAVKAVSWIIGRWGRSIRANVGRDPTGRASRSGRLADLIGDRMAQPGPRIELRVRGKAGLEAVAKIGAGYAFELLVELYWQIADRDKRKQLAAGARLK